MFEAFGCRVPHDNPDTPDRVSPDVFVERDMDVSFDLEMPDGNEVRMWVFTDPGQPETFPSPAIRVREGQIVHTKLSASKEVHTVHHHGIESTPFNDGVGHSSFEVTGSYIYQWRADEAGTYIYHCHVNTVLHFEMGMYGLIIVDPPQGPGFVRRANDVVPYDVEGFWVGDDIDPRWHDLHHHAGIVCPNGADAGLNRFEPRYFTITGVPAPLTRSDPRVVVNASVGETILLRVVCGGYTVQRYTIYGLDAEVIEIDGRPLGFGPRGQYSRPFTIPAGTPFELTSAQRRTLLLRPTTPGSFPAVVEFMQWGNRATLGVADTVINVT
jgi:FtsP/CotA-like multicopper oxidase with cupredoxin domain